jgi:hypothetical protein
MARLQAARFSTGVDPAGPSKTRYVSSRARAHWWAYGRFFVQASNA